MLTETLIKNIRKIMKDRNLTQAAIAQYMDTSESQFSKILSGSVQLSLKQVSNLASSLSIREIDLITYPDVYVKKGADEDKEAVEAVLQIRLRKNKKDEILRYILGDNNYELIVKDL